MKNTFAIRITLFFLVLFSTCTLWGNGGPVYVGSSINGTGDPFLRNISQVELLSERLSIRLKGDYSEVSVSYILFNNSNKDLKNVDYGFPVDFFINKGNEYEPRSVLSWKSDYVSGLKFSLDEKELIVRTKDDTYPSALLNKENDKWLRGYGYDDLKYRKWFLTSLNIDAQSVVKLDVSYTIKNTFYDYGDTDHARKLYYDFSPAANWGKGTVRDFDVLVDATEIIRDKGVVEAVEGLEMYSNEGMYRCKVKDFHLDKAKPLFISYMPNTSYTLLQDRLGSTSFTSKVSSEVKAYPVSSLYDMDIETAWVAAKQDEQPSISMTLNKPTHLRAIFLLGAYYKSQKAYEENNRIKKIRIDVRDKNGLEQSEIFDFEDASYLNFDFRSFGQLSAYYGESMVDFHQGGLIEFEYFFQVDEITNITVTILEVYPGSKYSDTCISELFLLRSSF